MKLSPNEVHIWSGSLAITPEQEARYQLILSHEEIKRVNQFKFAKDKRRFVAAHAMLRKILSNYINELPNNFQFTIGEHGKPALMPPSVEFNISHSDEMAVCAFALNHSVGIDIEKMQANFPRGVAEKYFSNAEKQAISHLPLEEQYKAFYQLWASKEALIKATGKGLFISLSDVSVSLQNDSGIITLENEPWALKQLAIHPDYQAALACHPSTKALSLFTYQHV